MTETGGTWDYTNGVGIEILWTLACGTTYQGTGGSWQTGNYLATANQVNGCDNVANDFRIAQVQFEPGLEATPFIQRHYADELAKCQRYYQRYDTAEDSGTYQRICTGQILTSTQADFTLPFLTRMRASPTLGSGSVTNLAIYHAGIVTPVTSLTANSTHPQSAGIRANTAGGLTAGRGAHLMANASNAPYLELDAEL